ncbi:MAG: hypothetical protein BM564_07430 [Bacteroidetes bacterium MedPE-SWsnd-G2]|nr:MAG: hypothetical protein BM564_07430 [Bacteroidetes bacterium MedPE-SWsnd-G2]
MKVIERTVTVLPEHLDHLNHVNNISYVKWVQDIAIKHWEINLTEEIRNLFYWVLIEHNIKYKGEAFLGDTINIKTYIKSNTAVTSIRKVEMRLQKNDKLIIDSETNWCLISTVSKKPTRITQEILDIFS